MLNGIGRRIGETLSSCGGGAALQRMERGDLSRCRYAIHVETPQESLQKISTSNFRALLDNVNLATDLEAELVWLKSSDVVEAILEFAREKVISKIILKRSRHGF
jgi:K+-sensing histidine kinase KdpD